MLSYTPGLRLSRGKNPAAGRRKDRMDPFRLSDCRQTPISSWFREAQRGRRSSGLSLSERKTRSFVTSFLRMTAYFWLVRTSSTEKEGHAPACPSQTVDKPIQSKSDSHGESARGDGNPLSRYNLCKNGNFFGSSHFCFSSCRHFVDSLKQRSCFAIYSLQ